MASERRPPVDESHTPPSGQSGTPFDESSPPDETLRRHYEALMEAVEQIGPTALSAKVSRSLAENEVLFGGASFAVDPLPRLITDAEWRRLERGLEQRARALNRFLLDVYSAQEIVAAGVVAPSTIDTADGFEPDLLGTLPQHGWPAAIIGFDVVRNSDGEFLVLEDNLRTPSGFAYALAARRAVQSALGDRLPAPRSLEPSLWELLAATLHTATPTQAAGPRVIVVLTDGPGNVAYYEHALAAQALGGLLATPDELVRDGSELQVTGADGDRRRVDVVYRRTNEDRLRDDDGELTDVGALLLEPWLEGSVGLVNAFGNGVADDKLIHGHVEDFVRFYLDEEPLIRSVPTTPVEADPEHVIEHLSELVIKPRHGHGGIGVTIGAHLNEAELEGYRRQLRENPGGYIAQPLVPLSLHPTLVDGRSQLRHVDLRPFSFAAQEVALLPGGLSRVALQEGALVVNSSQDGGGKDTWVLSDQPPAARPN